MNVAQMNESTTQKPQEVWVVCGPYGLHWAGLCKGETHAWTIALDWPDETDINAHKDRGWYAQRATVSWPGKQEPAPALDSALHTLAPFVHGLGKAILQDVSADIESLRAQLAARAPVAQGEPVMVYRGRCTIDCGEHGHHDVELLKMIPAGTKLYAAPQQASEPVECTAPSDLEINQRLGFKLGWSACVAAHKIGC